MILPALIQEIDRWGAEHGGKYSAQVFLPSAVFKTVAREIGERYAEPGSGEPLTVVMLRGVQLVEDPAMWMGRYEGGLGG